MPAFGGNITDQQLQQLTNFLQTLKTPSQGQSG